MHPFTFTVEHTCPATMARAATWHTPHGAVRTPAFMPVGTQATVKGLTPDDLETAGARIVLGNTYHLFLRPGHELIRALGGLHRFMAWPGAILTDSGGFQVWSLAKLRKITDDGVEFRAPLDGAMRLLTPELSIEIQRALESAVGADGHVTALAGPATLTIRPGYRFRAVDVLLTNFHLPRSSLLLLVAAFAGRDLALRAYRHAVAAGYRFYSYGDAMAIL